MDVMKSFLSVKKVVLVASLAIALAACGGGGGGGDNSDSGNSGDNGNNPPLAADFTTTDATCGAALNFDAGISAGSIAGYEWQFGDGDVADGATASHSYPQPGTYTAILTIVDAQGATAIKSREVTVTGIDGTYLCGTISVAANLVVDGDVNDPDAPYFSNDINAQPVTSPVTIVGYLNAAGEGSDGRSFAAGDTIDSYSIDLVAGATVKLETYPDPFVAHLLSLSPTGLGTSTNTSGNTVTASANGSYRMSVSLSANAATRYILTVTEPAPAIVKSSPVAQPGVAPVDATTVAFVPGEIIVAYDSLEAAAAGTARLHKAGFEGAHQAGPDLVLYRDEKLRTARNQLAARRETLRQIAALNREPGVRYAEPNRIRRMAAIPNDEFYSFQKWHYEAINLPAAWDITTGSDGVTVAVLDTGWVAAHPDFDGRYTNGYDFVSLVSQPGVGVAGGSADGDGMDADESDPGKSDVGNCNDNPLQEYHGLIAASIIGAETNTAPGRGSLFAGVTWSGKIMPLRVLGDCGDFAIAADAVGGGTTFDIANAMLYAAGLQNASGTVPAKRADIINMSFGGPGGALDYSQTEQDTVDAVRAAGVILVASAGNNADNTIVYPAAYDGVIAVSATDFDNAASDFTSFGSTIDVAAPGGDFGGNPDRQLAANHWFPEAADPAFPQAGYNGTSFAAPHVSGVLALMKAVYPDLTPEDVDTLLANGDMTTDLGDPGRDDYFGYGLIDAEKSVKAALDLKNTQPTEPPPGVDGDPGRQTLYVGALGNPATAFVLGLATADGTFTFHESFTEANPPYEVWACSDLDNDGAGAPCQPGEIGGVYGGDTANPTPIEPTGNATGLDFTLSAIQ